MDNYVDLGYLPPVESFDGNMAMDGDEYVRCSRCGYGGCDVRVSSCGCTLHAVRRNCTEPNCRKLDTVGSSSCFFLLTIDWPSAPVRIINEHHLVLTRRNHW